MNNLTLSGKISVLFACVLLLVVSASAQVSLRTALDYDKDGKADYSVFRATNNTWYILNSAGGFAFVPFGATDDTLTPGDYDGDGKSDISVFRDSNGAWYRLNSSNGAFSAVQFGASGDDTVARDYDGDGKTDQAVARRSNGKINWYVLGSTRGFFSAEFGNSGDFVAPGDYDGDGKFDFAVYRGSGADGNGQATFFVLRSRDGFTSVPFGLGNDSVVPGDYDGDGKTDYAVVRPGATLTSNLVWYVLKSSDNNLLAESFGVTGTDYTVQNDYDGDGKTDVAVWRDSGGASNGVFYYIRTSNRSLGVVPWGSSDDLPVADYDTH